jgi:hypothetical protein
VGILDEAAALVEGERADAYGDCVAYGDATLLHARAANLFNAYLDGRAGLAGKSDGLITAYDVAVFMALIKIARMAYSPSEDSHRDLAGYASICQTIFEATSLSTPPLLRETNGGS